MERRQFFRALAGSGLLLTCAPRRTLGGLIVYQETANLSRVEARYYKKHPDREIECILCPRNCRLGDKERGYCGVRENIGGTYFTLVYGKACADNVDPIEKKPFFHFLPGTRALSIATAGCNVNCKFCQNWQISQVRAEQVDHFDFPPKAVVKASLDFECPSIAYTYTEPVVFYEYMYDTSVEAHKKGIRNCVVTGGHIHLEPLAELIKVVDAIKVDLKSFNQDFYKNYVRGELQPVLEAIKLTHQSKVWLEIVYLVIPTLNDSPTEIRRMCQWILKEIGPDVPLHFSRFVPMYLIKNLPPTPLSTLEKSCDIARSEGLRYVYLGNVPGHKDESTYCPRCQKKIIERVGFEVRRIDLVNGTCNFCQNPIPGIWT